MAVWVDSGKLMMNLSGWYRRTLAASATSSSAGVAWKRRLDVAPLRCSPLEQDIDIQRDLQSQDEDLAILCEPCKGTGWLVCDLCKGQKTNVKAKNNRIYRRCPTCKAVGYILCSKCKVFKCVTFPDFEDGDLLVT
ncbi:uncharacterized protein LOC120256649 [Dioscorea cayenensis subsp. rotundata]|uniref:Uncharacterized protein LOC120256649 n=1 Tax=Dioscorea cayennensis subsp. rotundata TaxID=55577 RepID=A0AB40AZW3_DIOCR|nr:uncharacterized protein LOC120256649 [Dioscorea cayenensis subsp. rotundata]